MDDSFDTPPLVREPGQDFSRSLSRKVNERHKAPEVEGITRFVTIARLSEDHESRLVVVLIGKLRFAEAKRVHK